MGFQRLTPIHSTHEEDEALRPAIDDFVVGLGEWIDELQDTHAAGDLVRVAAAAHPHAALAERLGYPALRDGATQVARCAEAGEDQPARKAIGDLIEIVQRIRLGHRSAA